ncbi:MAG: glycerol-3-phosphate 1-O-acyltransferase [Rhodospirillaceae bacterium]|nr:glycerol-3-phosphate 1-O-acyltransferase [Rhodospirillaceae bacterium]
MISGFPLWAYGAAIVAGYFLGSIPFGLFLTRLAGAGDIRAIGSGNIGATNVLRTGRKGLAFCTLILDGGKGAAAILVVNALVGGSTSALALIAGGAAVLGHNFPIWLRFKGGKGVATTLGLMIAAMPVVGVMACLTWFAIAVVFRLSSLAALVALALAPIYALALGRTDQAIAFTGLGLLGWVRHATNLRRLLKGEEPRIGVKSGGTPDDPSA